MGYFKHSIAKQRSKRSFLSTLANIGSVESPKCALRMLRKPCSRSFKASAFSSQSQRCAEFPSHSTTQPESPRLRLSLPSPEMRMKSIAASSLLEAR